MPGSGYEAGCGEARGRFHRIGLDARWILEGLQGCKTVAVRFNHRQLLLDLGEKGVYSSYTLKLTGMPAWGAFHTDQQIWELVAFVGKLKGMSVEVFETLSGAGEHNSQQSAHSHMPLQSHGQ